ncbi:hypothetical protein GCM10008959_09780 [Deinococcus seoulensis]|uniref:OmpR/PhoB-type domain-containing protein n=1 Tax=Deinococcus seoulensis TaxID=1837379 RepID=A0ABQ2RNM7_9DEIO|nr:winged helix-turn-helix domain-containing protein [Deinococcus seoulensis]GGR50557.1 hypothetical protein GCM10008959_09780 [Deinococcus seoulensis]
MNHSVRQEEPTASPASVTPTPPVPAPPGIPAGAGAAETGSLTAREQAVFDLLRVNPGRLYTRAEILERVWGLEFSGDERVVDAYVNRIRRKLEGAGGDAPLIETVRGAGYRCAPGVGGGRRAWPHLSQLPVEAQELLSLVSAYGSEASPGAILQVLLDNMGRVPNLSRAALLNVTPPVPEVLAAAGTVDGRDGPTLHVPLPAQPGVTVAFTGLPGAEWDAGTRAYLRGAARLVGGSLLRALDLQAERRAYQRLREQVQVLEDRALRSRQDSAALLSLTHLLEGARGVPDILNVSLPVLAELAGTDACAAWFPHAGGPPGVAVHRTGLPLGMPDPDRFTPDVPGPDTPGVLSVEIGEQTLRLLPFSVTDAPAPPVTGQEASALLPAAARCVALALSQATLLRALERSALTDEYTGLGNRQAFLADLHAEVAFAARHGARFAVTLVDLGNIRYLNATAGYAGGNDLISRLARTLRAVTRAEDRAYRLNGATFALLLRFPSQEAAPEAAGDPAVRGWQERLGGALSHLRRGAPVPLDLHTSLVVCPEDAAGTSDLFRLALDRLSPAQWPEQPPEQPRGPTPATVRPPLNPGLNDGDGE